MSIISINQLLMKLVESEFQQLNSEVIDWNNILFGKVESDLDKTKLTLFDLFSQYFKSFYKCVEFALNEFKDSGIYYPIMISITTKSDYFNYGEIPLPVFDDLKDDDKPIWWTKKFLKHWNKNFLADPHSSTTSNENNKTNRKYLSLLFLCIAMPLMLFFIILIMSLVFSILFYFKINEFVIDIKDIYLACKIASLGIPAGIWYLECRRLGIKIFGK